MARAQAQAKTQDQDQQPDPIDQLIDHTFILKGGYINHPADKGGPTKYGITQVTLSRWLKRQVTADDVKKLEKDTAREIYRAEYFDGPGLGRLPKEVLPCVFDIAVISGVKRAVCIVQEAINTAGHGPCKVDGIIGSTTCTRAAQAQAAVGDLFNNTIVLQRIAFLENLLARRPTQEVNRQKWINDAKAFFKHVE
jgi:lysozyme family protein